MVRFALRNLFVSPSQNNNKKVRSWSRFLYWKFRLLQCLCPCFVWRYAGGIGEVAPVFFFTDFPVTKLMSEKKTILSLPPTIKWPKWSYNARWRERVQAVHTHKRKKFKCHKEKSILRVALSAFNTKKKTLWCNAVFLDFVISFHGERGADGWIGGDGWSYRGVTQRHYQFSTLYFLRISSYSPVKYIYVSLFA